MIPMNGTAEKVAPAQHSNKLSHVNGNLQSGFYQIGLLPIGASLHTTATTDCLTTGAVKRHIPSESESLYG
jgi:hypothetical protein